MLSEAKVLPSDTRQNPSGIDIVFENIEYSVQTEAKRDEFKLPCKKEY